MKKLLSGLFLSLLVSCFGLAPALAAPLSHGRLAVSPAIEQITLPPGQTSASFNAALTNDSNTPLLLTISTSDFTAQGPYSGGLSFLSSQNPAHGLAKWLTPSQNNLTLPPNSSLVIPIALTDLTTLAPGGHYGAVIFKAASPGQAHSANSVSVNEEVSLLVFLTTFSGAEQAISLDKPELSSVVTSLPKNINLVFKNTGNTQTPPRGLVTIIGSHKKVIARGVINTESGLVLPGTSRLYQVNLDYFQASPPWGHYELYVSYQAGSASTAKTFVHGFTYVSQLLIDAIVVILLAGFLYLVRASAGPKTPKSSLFHLLS